MELCEKKDLTRLLAKYQDDLLGYDDANRSLRPVKGMDEWEKPYHRNARSQYEHARIIVAQLSKEIGTEMLKKEQL